MINFFKIDKMPKSSHSSIKFGFWNIGGLCTRGMNKAEDSIFLKNFEPYDIIFLYIVKYFQAYCNVLYPFLCNQEYHVLAPECI
jgi:hypothetical protein